MSMLAHVGFLVVCLVDGCQCPTTPPIAAGGPQSMQRALEMGAAGGAGPGQGAPVCFHGAETKSQAPYDACLAAAPDSVCGGGRWCAAVPAAMLGRTIGWGAKWAGPLHLLARDYNNRLAMVEVLDTASWGLHYTWACEDGGKAR
jgi:hypothetical protein